MKVLVLANDEQKEELLSLPVDESVTIQWHNGSIPFENPGDLDACIDLLFENSVSRIKQLRELGIPLIVINSVITTLDELGADFIRINGWTSFIKREVVEASAAAEDTRKMLAERLFSHLGRTIEWTPDIPGFISARVIATIINEAFLTVEENVSVEKEIDTAMKLGTNYPYGPFEWGEKIGLDKVVSLLEVLEKEQNRYKPSPLLKNKILV
jgi:3-hydroxybutyryl-CoA dehydrogenase